MRRLQRWRNDKEGARDRRLSKHALLPPPPPTYLFYETSLLLHIGPAHFALAHVLLFEILCPFPVTGACGHLGRRRRDRRRERTGRDLEAIRARVMAPGRGDVRHVPVVPLRGDLVLLHVGRSTRRRV